MNLPLELLLCATPIWSHGGTACVMWTGYINDRGYGKVVKGRKIFGAHRIAYEKAKGAIPAGLVIDHLCRNRTCINPEHLEAVTNQDNVLRGVGRTAQNARKTHCPYGHEYTEQNTVYKGRTQRKPHNSRSCRLCLVNYKRAARDRAKADRIDAALATSPHRLAGRGDR